MPLRSVFSAAALYAALCCAPASCISADTTAVQNRPSGATAVQVVDSTTVVEFSQLECTDSLRLLINTVDLSDPDSVHLRCSVIDRSGRHVVGLAPSSTPHRFWNNLTEYAGGDSTVVQHFSVTEIHEHEAPAFSSVFVLDYSASMDRDITNVLLALERSTALLRSGRDDFSVVQFDQRVQTPLRRVTSTAAIDSLTPFFDLGGMTAFYSAAQRGLRDIALSEKDRVAILISDGVDNASLQSANDVIREARAAHARVYIIGLANADHAALQHLGEQTGARLYFPQHSSELTAIFSDIYRMNNVYYNISYARPKGDNRRTTGLSVALPDGRRLADHKTYYANPELVIERRSIILARYSENRTVIAEPFENEVQQIVHYLREHPEQSIIVRAHTDTKGSDAVNDRLSRNRAHALADYLVSRGVHRSQISAVQGMGKRLPLYPDDRSDPQLQYENRRGEVLFLEHTALHPTDGARP